MSGARNILYVTKSTREMVTINPCWLGPSTSKYQSRKTIISTDVFMSKFIVLS